MATLLFVLPRQSDALGDGAAHGSGGADNGHGQRVALDHDLRTCLDAQQDACHIAHSISFEYPIASGVTTAQPEPPFNQLQPNPIDLAQLGDGRAAIALLKQAQLL